MRKHLLSFTVLLLCLFTSFPGFSQSGKGVIIGVAKDSAGAVLQGAKVELQPQVRPMSTDGQGSFTITGVAPGPYAIPSSTWVLRPTPAV